MHISSFLILCKPENRRMVADAAAALPGVEVCHSGANGKIVAIAEGGTETHITHALQTLQDLRGVVTVNLVYHGVEESTGDAGDGD